MKIKEILSEKWSEKYKRSINCASPKGFSQKAHCAGRKKNENIDDEEFTKGNNWGLSPDDADNLIQYLDNMDGESNITRTFDDYPGFEYMYEYYTQRYSGGDYFWDYLRSGLEDIRDGDDIEVEEGWKSKMAGAALAAANLLGSPAQAADEPVKPITIATVIIDGEVRQYNLGDKFSSAKEAEKFISNVLSKQGLSGYTLDIRHGYPKKKDVKEGYGRYWCSTDKKWKERKGPKQKRSS